MNVLPTAFGTKGSGSRVAGVCCAGQVDDRPEAQVQAAQDRVQPVDPRHLPGVPDDVDDAVGGAADLSGDQAGDQEEVVEQHGRAPLFDHRGSAPFNGGAAQGRQAQHVTALVVAMPATDPLAGSDQVDVADLRGRASFRLPPGTDPQWCDFWLATDTADPDPPVVSTIGECLHAVVWRSAVGLLPAAAARRHAAPGVSFP